MITGDASRAGRLVLAILAVSLLCAAPASEVRITAVDALARLRAGNERFVKDASVTVPLGSTTRQALATGQNPFATILSCADSRVPPDNIFNTGLGELFVIRAAGEVVDRSVMASLEDGAEHLHTPLLLQFLVSAIRAGITRSSSERHELRAAILANVEQVINDALGGSQILRTPCSRQPSGRRRITN